MHDLHARIFRHIFIAYSRASVRRTVIDYDYFHILQHLRRKAVKALAKIFFNFINRHYNAYHMPVS